MTMNKIKKSFDHFMWMKIVGKLDGMGVRDDVVISVPTESIYKFQYRMKILNKHGVKYPDWKTAKKILKGVLTNDHNE